MSRASGEFAASQDVLLGPAGGALIELMLGLAFDRPERYDPAAAALAGSLGWVEETQPPLTLTPLGAKVGDSIREFTLWRERGGALHAQDLHPALHPSSFTGKRVLEVGSGSGCNLLSVGDTASVAFGIDVEPVYLGISPALSAHFKAPVATAACAAAEKLPFASGSFDVALCLGSLQYTDIRVTIAEMGRVLAPGGRAIIVLGTFRQLMGRVAEEVRPRNARKLVRLARSVMNTIGVEVTGSRVSLGGEASATGRPVYPSRSRLVRYLREANLALVGAPASLAKSDTLFVAERGQTGK